MSKIVTGHHGVSLQKERDILLIHGWIREFNKCAKLQIPLAIKQVIVDYHYRIFQLLRFNNTVDAAMGSHYKFDLNRTKAIKKDDGPFYYVISDLIYEESGCKEGVHVFRFKIENPSRKDMLWGISPFNQKIKPPSYNSDYVYGFQVYGQYVAGGNRMDDKSYTFMGTTSSLLLDVKLDCDNQRLSFIPIKLEPKTNKCKEMIGKEYSLHKKLPNDTSWIPHFQGYYSNISVSIAKIDPSLFGVFDEQMHKMFSS